LFKIIRDFDTRLECPTETKSLRLVWLAKMDLK
jgi:hypothetical protein